MSIRDYFVAKQRELERKERLETAGKVGFGLALGALVGSAAGILFAPKSGKETREDIANAAEETGRQIKDKSKELGQGVVNTYNKTVEKISGFGQEKLTELKDVTQDVKKDVAEVVKEGAKKVEKKASEVKEKAEEVEKNRGI